MQVKLLRAIQEKKVRKVGSTVEEAVDLRIISATHHQLRTASMPAPFARISTTE
jgi:two-component system response regulator PilR (NtrC family)